MSSPDVELKMLIPAQLAGAIIGRGGSAINQLSEISGARIRMGNHIDFYPGSGEQVVYIAGSDAAVDMVQELLWHKLAQGRPVNSDSEPWSPRAMLEKLRTFPSSAAQPLAVTGKILLPFSICGSIIGHSGSAIRSLSEETGVHIQLARKDDAISNRTQERMVTISGEVENCIQCTASMLARMQGGENSTNVGYQNKTPSYSFLGISQHAGDEEVILHRKSATLLGGNADSTYNTTRDRSANNASSGPQLNIGSITLPQGVRILSATSTVTLVVPGSAMGSIIGKKGAALAELQIRTGAKVSVAPRTGTGESDRTVVIVGHPDEVTAATRALFDIIKVSGNNRASRAKRSHRSGIASVSHSHSFDDESSDS